MAIIEQPIADVNEKFPDDSSQADLLICRLLCVNPGKERSSKSTRGAQNMFSKAMLISAARCLLTYIFLPFVAPLAGFSASVGPAIGIPLAIVALVFDIIGIRRFFLAKHKSRWVFFWIYLSVIGLVLALLAVNIYDLVK